MQNLQANTPYNGRPKSKEKTEDILAAMLVSKDGSVGIEYVDAENVIDLSAAGGGAALAARVTALEATAMLKPDYDADNDLEVDRVDEQRDILTVAAFGQTAFTLSRMPLQPTYSELTVNGVRQGYGTGYTIAGANLTYIPGVPALNLDPTDEVIIIYR